MSFWDSVKSTMGALGDGVTAVPGMVWDTGSYVFDDLDGDDDTNFGEYMGKMAKRGRQQVALALDPKTLSGHAFLSTMKGLDWLYSEGISQPMVTTSMMIGRAAEGHGGDLFSGDQWKRAYHLAEHRSIGQQSMLTTGAGLDALAPGQQMPDVFDPKAWQRMHDAAPLTTSVVSGSQDFAARWYLDPGNVAGKGYQAYKAAVGVRSITAADRAAGIGNLLENEFVKKVGVGPFKFSSKKAGLATRTAQLIGGTDDAGRFLPGYIDDKNAAQILRGVEELDKSAKGPQIASMLADTNKLTDAGERLEARRRILRVAYGDTAENNRVSTEIGHVNDALDNLQKDSVTNIEREMAHELQPALFYGHGEATRPFDNPDVIDAAQAQVQNLPGIAEHWDNQLADLQALEDISGSAARNPLRVSGAGKRRLARDEERTLFRDEGAIGSKIEAAKQWATADSIESVYQYGSMNMPLRIMKKLAGVGMQGTDAVYRKAPLGAIDKLRTSSPTGVVALHDVQGTVREVDSALRKVGMPHRDRFAIVSDVMGARTESERMMAVTRAESAGAHHLAERYGVDRDFIDTVMQRGYRRRKGMMMSLKGRAYSASTSADGLRVDMFDDHGVPVALPMLETQNVNIMPMLDMEHAEKMLARDRRIAKISKAWKAENDELEKYAKQRLTKGDSLAEITKGLYSVADHMLVWGDELMRYWKFSALFRLGYGIRVLADDEMRIFARMGAGNQLPIWWEAIKNHGYNKVGYRFDPAARRAAIVARIQSLEDRIGSADDVKRAHDGIARIEELNNRRVMLEGDAARNFDTTKSAPNVPASYHGSETEGLDEIQLRGRDEVDATSGQYYGPGLYTSVDPHFIADTYGGKGKVYRMHSDKPQKVFDLADEISDKDIEGLARYIESHPRTKADHTGQLKRIAQNIRERKYSEQRERDWSQAEEGDDDPFALGGEDMGAAPHPRPEKYTWQEMFDKLFQDNSGSISRFVTDYLEKTHGATVLKQQGGTLFGGHKHDVYIWLKPEHGKMVPAHLGGKREVARDEYVSLREKSLIRKASDRRPDDRAVYQGEPITRAAYVGQGHGSDADFDTLFNSFVHKDPEQHRSNLGEQFDTLAAERVREERDDLQARAGILQDMVHLDVDDLVAERDGLVSALRSGAYKRREFAAGKIQLPGGDTVDDAFSGPWAGAVRTQISSNDAMMMELEDAESSMMSHFAKAGSWRTILPQEGGAHLEGWAWAINKHLRQSKLAQVFIRGGNKDDALRYLRTPGGRRLRKQMAWVGADPEQWVTRVEKMVNDYIPEGPLREAVLSREVTPNELGDMFPDVMRRPEVHGANVDLNVGTGNISHALNKIANRYFEFVSKHTDKLGRHPYYVGMYRQNVRELHAGALAQARAAGRQLDSDDFAKITHQASRQAVHDLKKTLFDISAHSNAATMMRFVSPFFAAHQESIAKWYRIISDDPSVVRRFQQFFDIPRKLGLTVNVNTGKPVASGEPVSSDHAIMIQVPRAWLSKQDQSKWKTDWTISEESFNLILQSGGVFNPGVGPIVQAPLDHFARTLADQPDIEKLARLLNPIPSDSVADAILPAAVRRTFAALAGENSHEFSASMAMDLNDRLVQFQEDKHRGPTQAEYNRMVVESKKSTQIRAWLRVGQQMLSPVSIRPGSRFAAQRAGWYKLLDQSYQNGKGYQWAERQFLNKYGAAMAPLMESTSNNVAGIQSRSAETIASIKRHRGLLDVVNPKLAALVIGPEGEGAFSDAANAALKGMRVQPGTDQTYISYDDPRDAGMEALVSEGWRRYNKITSGLNAQAHAYGLASYTDSTELSDLKAKATRQLAEQNFAWWQDYNSFDPSEYGRMVDDMKVIAKDRTLNGDTARNDIQVLKRYLDARDVMTQQLQSRDAMGGSADPTAVSNQDLSQWFTYQVSQLVESNTSFAQFGYDPIISKDPYLSQTAGVAA